MTPRSANPKLAIKEPLERVRIALGDVNKNLQALESRSKKLSSANESLKTDADLDKLDQEIRSSGETNQRELDELKRKIEEEPKTQVWDILSPKMNDVLKMEVKKQVGAEVAKQIAAYIPISLEKQADENKTHIKQLKYAISNSKARMENYMIRETEYDKVFVRVLKEDGEVSGRWPCNLRALYEYDENTTRELVEDYDLKATQDVTVNCNMFLAHIGTRLQMFTCGTEEEEEE